MKCDELKKDGTPCKRDAKLISVNGNRVMCSQHAAWSNSIHRMRRITAGEDK